MAAKNIISRFTADLKGKKRTVNVIVSDDFPYNYVKVCVKVSFSGSPAVKEFLATCAHLAMNRNHNRLLRGHMHGYKFNPYANRMNVRDFRYEEGRGIDGAVESFSLSCFSKPHMVGKALAILCTMFYHEAKGGDMSYPYVRAFTRDTAHVQWGMSQLAAAVGTNGELSVMVGKPKQVKSDWDKKFKKVFDSKVHMPKGAGKAFTAKDVIDAKTGQPCFHEGHIDMGPKEVLTFDLSKSKSDYSLLYLAQIVGRSNMNVTGKKLSCVIYSAEKSWVMRQVRSVCRSEGGIARMTNIFMRFASKSDKSEVKAVNTSLALVATMEGMPRAYVDAIGRGTKLPDVKQIHKDLSALC